jgi:lipopolysaccharide export LptBFGC system permease protein LptF
MVLTGVFASCNLFLRLPFIADAGAIPLLVLTMLPLMTLFSLPISSSLAIATVRAQHVIHQELLVLSFFKNARRALIQAILIFSTLATMLYAILVFQLAPQSYQKGKQLLIKAAQERLLSLEPNKFHSPFSSVTFFFREKDKRDPDNPAFNKLFLVFIPSRERNERYFFTADRGLIKRDRLFLYNGSMHTFKGGHIHSATFQETEIDFQRFIDVEKNRTQLSNLKFFTWDKLIASWQTERDALIEFHKRSAQSLWQFCSPFIVFFLASVLGLTSLIANVVLCGIVYLFSYISMTGAQTQGTALWLALLFLYLPLLCSIGCSFYVYMRHGRL